MKVHELGLIEYEKARVIMQEIHDQALQDGQNHLILCSHPNVFTLGSDKSTAFEVPTVASDRGGSITCHTPGQCIFYYCFQAAHPAQFYKKVLTAFESFFNDFLPAVKYDKQNPGFYIQNRKIASLGFRYSQGVSLHGVALNVGVDLDFHTQVAPCNLEGVLPTSLLQEGVIMSEAEVNAVMLKRIEESFGDHVQT
jgi:lipoyl(octanoyl) transferase